MTFEEYLVSKKIDGEAFMTAEPELYKSWNFEFAQMHANSFTAQKLYLINPIRLKYTLIQRLENEKVDSIKAPDSIGEKLISDQSNQTEITSPSEGKPAQTSKSARPVFKSKPKMN